MSESVNIAVAILGSGALSAAIAGIFALIQDRRGRLSKIETQLKGISEKLVITERDELRTQLLLLLSDYPGEKQEIMKLAEHYFKDLGGNWYATSLFNSWLLKNKIAKPEWFSGDVNGQR